MSLSDYQQAVKQPLNGVAQARTHDAVHEVTHVSSAVSQPTYDGKGNLTANLTGAVYAWDMENRLSTATVSDESSGATGTAYYRYDALGRRIQKSVYRTTTTYIHDGAQVVDEFDTPTKRPNSSSHSHGDGSGQPPGVDPLADQSSATRIDAQPWSSPIPSGFMGDFGQVNGLLDNNQTYGWDSDQSANAVSRGVEIALPQFDSFIQFGTQSPAPSATWSIGNLTPGTYAVIAVFGDAASTNQTNDVSIQSIPEHGLPAQPDVPGYPNGNFDGFAETVTVTSDGTISIGALSTAFNPKLCFVEIGPVGSSITPADRANLAALVAQANAATHQTQAIQKKQPTPRLYVYGSYVDEPLMMKAGGSKYYFATNHLYSVAALTDSTGAVVERYKYDAYGRQGIMNTNGSVSYCPSDYGNFIGFTGRYHDWETGLVFYRTRYMDTTLGRFINRMPWFGMNGLQLSNYSISSMNDTWRAIFSSELSRAQGSYLQGRYNLYDFEKGDPANSWEPFSQANANENTPPPDPAPGPKTTRFPGPSSSSMDPQNITITVTRFDPQTGLPVQVETTPAAVSASIKTGVNVGLSFWAAGLPLDGLVEALAARYIADAGASLIGESSILRVYHKGMLDNPDKGSLSTGLCPVNVGKLNRDGPVNQFDIPQSLIDKWEQNGLIQRFKDFDAATGTYNEEIRFLYPADQQVIIRFRVTK